jgi:hypothetical protein
MSDSITTVGQTRPDDALQVSGAAAAELLCIQAADDVFSSAQDRQALSELLLQVLTSLWCNYGHYCSEVTLLPHMQLHFVESLWSECLRAVAFDGYRHDTPRWSLRLFPFL